MAITKTNAMRILDKNKINYEILTYENKDGKIDGVSVAEKLGINEKYVFKTLVTVASSKSIYVFVIPVSSELDFKKAAKIAGEKNIEMINVNDLLKYTGYIRGGCSPLGMKKMYKTFIDNSANTLEYLVFSGGKIGVQIKIKPTDLKDALTFEFEELIK